MPIPELVPYAEKRARMYFRAIRDDVGNVRVRVDEYQAKKDGISLN